MEKYKFFIVSYSLSTALRNLCKSDLIYKMINRPQSIPERLRVGQFRNETPHPNSYM